jgi:hypothetical protein
MKTGQSFLEFLRQRKLISFGEEIDNEFQSLKEVEFYLKKENILTEYQLNENKKIFLKTQKNKNKQILVFLDKNKFINFSQLTSELLNYEDYSEILFLDYLVEKRYITQEQQKNLENLNLDSILSFWDHLIFNLKLFFSLKKITPSIRPAPSAPSTLPVVNKVKINYDQLKTQIFFYFKKISIIFLVIFSFVITMVVLSFILNEIDQSYKQYQKEKEIKIIQEKISQLIFQDNIPELQNYVEHYYLEDPENLNVISEDMLNIYAEKLIKFNNGFKNIKNGCKILKKSNQISNVVIVLESQTGVPALFCFYGEEDLDIKKYQEVLNLSSVENKQNLIDNLQKDIAKMQEFDNLIMKNEENLNQLNQQINELKNNNKFLNNNDLLEEIKSWEGKVFVLNGFIVSKVEDEYNLYEISTNWNNRALLKTTTTEFKSKGNFSLKVIQGETISVKLKPEYGSFNQNWIKYYEYDLFLEEKVNLVKDYKNKENEIIKNETQIKNHQQNKLKLKKEWANIYKYDK